MPAAMLRTPPASGASVMSAGTASSFRLRQYARVGQAEPRPTAVPDGDRAGDHDRVEQGGDGSHEGAGQPVGVREQRGGGVGAGDDDEGVAQVDEQGQRERRAEATGGGSGERGHRGLLFEVVPSCLESRPEAVSGGPADVPASTAICGRPGLGRMT